MFVTNLPRRPAAASPRRERQTHLRLEWKRFARKLQLRESARHSRHVIDEKLFAHGPARRGERTEWRKDRKAEG